MEEAETASARKWMAIRHVGVAFATGLAFCLGVYVLIEYVNDSEGLISFTFLLLLPAIVSAFVAWTGDPFRERSRSFYLQVPVWLLAAVVFASFFFLQEGVVCILMLAPIWLASAYFGIWALRRLRPTHESYDTAVFRSSLLVLPLIAMQVEPMIPLPERHATVTREIVVEATPEQIWPLLRGMQNIDPKEGRWNLTQDLVGIPRPVGARLDSDGIGATRHADWGEHIKFREHIIDWERNARIGWRFQFDDTANWGYTDRHLMPDSHYFKVLDGGYRLDAIGDGRTKVTLHTRYWMKTPVNLYSLPWGELFLGDISSNLLALVKQRAETPGASATIAATAATD